LAPVWRPSHYQWKAGKRVVTAMKSDELSALQLACTTYFADILTRPLRDYAEIKYYTPMSVSIHEKALHVGDDVLTEYETGEINEYARVGRFIEVHVPLIGVFLLWFPRWYQRVSDPVTREPAVHAHSGYPRLAKYFDRDECPDEDAMPFPRRYTHDANGRMLRPPSESLSSGTVNLPLPVSQLHEQVMVVHQCHSEHVETKGGYGSKSFCQVVCTQHSKEACMHHGCKSANSRSFKHHPSNDVYLVVSRHRGFF
jgi:hypothetical protein